MSGITFSGLASGIDTDSIVSKIMEIERQPLDRLKNRRNEETERLNAFYQFKGRLDALKKAVGSLSLTSQVRTTKVTLSSEESFTATAKNAAIGSYSISVAQLAQVQKTVTDGFASKTAPILGTGNIEINGTTIEVNSSNNTLVGLVESINAQAAETGVSVSIINDGSDTAPYHLVFTGKDASSSFSVTASLNDTSGDPVAFNTTVAQTARESVSFIDGIKVVSGSNTIKDAIRGITLNLSDVSKITSSGTEEPNVPPWEWADPPQYATTTVTVSADNDALKEKISTFVTAYNSVIEFINSGYEEEFGPGTAVKPLEGKEDDNKEEKLLGALLRGDATVNGVKRQLQNLLVNKVDSGGKFTILSEIGITTQKDGSLKQMKHFNARLLKLTSPSSGMYANQKSAYLSSVEDIDKQMDVFESRMTKREATLRAQFTAMEQLVSAMNAQSDFLAQQLNALNNTTRRSR
ncbi:MAG: flagellar hook-associated protein 2 [Deltaproteobacteria bacterium]|nr:MAG: flagellar hook-associated protein 2 [Deltaproteobacteria bacterium]